MVAFNNGLRKGKFLFSLYKNDPKTTSDVLYRATKYMNAEDALQPERTNLERGKDRKIPGRIGGEKWLGLENGGKTDVLSPPLGSSQVSPP